MKWTQDAETAIKRVPFFVRKRVRARVEKEAAQAGRAVVSLADVKATQARYLKNMESEIKGYRIETCFGPGGCPNRIRDSASLADRIEDVFKKEDLAGFLKKRVSGKLKFHHEFSLSLADCPNACSQPQIKDIGIIGAAVPTLTDNACTGCMACVEVCREGAIIVDDALEIPVIDADLCVKCGQCATVCPTGTIGLSETGFRVQLGGKLGRHPRLAEELPGMLTEDEVVFIVKSCIAFYKKHSHQGERLAALLVKDGSLIQTLKEKIDQIRQAKQ